MPSYKKFENDFKKYSGVSDLTKSPKTMIKEKEISEIKRKNIIDWTTFYRRNLHRFVEHYFGIKLHPYQIFWVYLMGIYDTFYAIAARAAAKSWILGVVSLARGVLYPNSEIVIVAATMKQASIILGKISRLRDDYSNIAREIHDLSMTNNKLECTLHNGSKIKVVSASESGRGERSTFTIYEEFRIMEKSVVDAIVKPFAYSRQAPFMQLPEWKNVIEEPKEVYISSAYHKGLWWYDEVRTGIKMMMKGKSVCFIAFDYLIAIYHRIKTKKQIEKEKSTMDEITFLEEYENIPWGENADAYYKLDMFRRNQKIKKAFYPQRNETYDKKKNPYDIKKQDGEIRIVSVDIATRAGKANDNSVITCTRLLPTHLGYEREVGYIETSNGENTILQALRIKQVFYDFSADYIVLDLQQAGIAIYDTLGNTTKDEERDLEYEAFTVMNHESIDKKTYEELLARTLALNAKPIIYPISGTPQLNNDIAVQYRDKLQKNLVKFLISEMDAEEYFIKTKKDYLIADSNVSDRTWLLHPYVQTAIMINESIGLSMVLNGGLIKLVEQSGARKDRYTSVSYMNYFVSWLDKDLMKQYDDEGDADFLARYIV
jgi:hypothetical protein